VADEVGSVSVWNGFALGPSSIFDGAALSIARVGQALAIQNAIPGTKRNFRRRIVSGELSRVLIARQIVIRVRTKFEPSLLLDRRAIPDTNCFCVNLLVAARRGRS